MRMGLIAVLATMVVGLAGCSEPENRVQHGRQVAAKQVEHLDMRTWSVAGFGGLAEGTNPPILAFFRDDYVFLKRKSGEVEKLEFFSNFQGSEICLKDIGDCYSFMPINLLQKVLAANVGVATSSEMATNTHSRQRSEAMGPIWPCAEGSPNLADCPERASLTKIQRSVAKFIDRDSAEVSHILVAGDFDDPDRPPKFLILGRGFEGDAFELRKASRRAGNREFIGGSWDAALDEGPAVLGLASAAVTLWAAIDRLTR